MEHEHSPGPGGQAGSEGTTASSWALLTDNPALEGRMATTAPLSSGWCAEVHRGGPEPMSLAWAEWLTRFHLGSRKWTGERGDG